MPLISVVVPTHNRAPLVARALHSVLAQTFQDFEIIVVDDASADSTEEVVRSFSDPRILYVRHETNLGGPAARNTGIRKARGEFVAFLDSDDEWLPQKLAAQLEVFRNSDLPHLGVVTCPLQYVYDGRTKVKTPSPIKFARGWLFRPLLLKQPVVHWNTSCLMVRRDALTEDKMFDESLPCVQDWDFLLRLSLDWQIESAQEPLVVVHHHGGQRVGWSGNDLRAAEIIFSKYYDLYAEEPRILGGRYYRLAWRYFRAGDSLKCRVNSVNAFKHDKRLLKALILYCLSFAPLNPVPRLHGFVRTAKMRLQWLRY